MRPEVFTVPLTRVILNTAKAPNIPYVDDIDDEPSDEVTPSRSYVELLDQLPPMDADILELRLRGVNQFVLADLFGLTQADISHRLSQTAKRLRFLAARPQYSRDELRAILRGVDLGVLTYGVHRVGTPVVDFLVEFWFVGSNTHAAKSLRIPPNTTWTWLRKSIATLERLGGEYGQIADALREIQKWKGWIYQSEAPWNGKASIEARRTSRVLHG